ncbi:LysR family transcriptional regulator [Brucella sp. LJL56]
MAINETDLRALRVFIAITQSGGFAKAQNDLNLSQPTISNMIAGLEEKVGFRVCDRGRAGFKLTVKGEELYRLAHTLFASFETFNTEVANLRKELIGDLNIGFTDDALGFSSPFMDGLLKSFCHSAPNIRLIFAEGDRAHLEQKLQETRIDLLIGHLDNSERYFQQNLYADEYSLYAAPNHYIFGSFGTSSELLGNAKYVRRAFPCTAEIKCLSEVSVSAIAHSTPALISLLKTGHLIGFLSSKAAAEYVLRGELMEIKVPEMHYRKTISAFRRKNSKPNRLVRTFLSHLEEFHATNKHLVEDK